MLRKCSVCRLTLPFEPMALTTLDFLNSQLQKSPQQLAQEEGIDAFKSGHIFISPKHDGVRVVSYVDVSRSSTQKSIPIHLGMQKCGDLVEYNQSLKTCFSRHGRPIWGMQWIEQELHLLRALSGDPYLVVDGELYLHKDVESTHDHKKIGKNNCAPVKKRKESNSAAFSAPPDTQLMTGFLAVASLVHRLRGKLQNPTLQDVLQYVPALPLYCLFDVASYSPRKLFFTCPQGAKSSAHNKLVLNELKKLQAWCLRENAVTDIRTLQIVPNVTPFSSRLRTLAFFASLLRYGKESKILSSAFCPWYEKARTSAPRSLSEDRKSVTLCSTSYLGGRFVKIIPYSLCNSLQDAQAHFLPTFIERGFEGAVIRTPLNVYAMREKRKGILSSIVTAGCLPLKSDVKAEVKKVKESSSISKSSLTSVGMKRLQLEQAYVRESAAIRKGLLGVAIQRGKKLPRRSPTAVKLLLYKDDEFQVLKPLFKEPSLNPRTRQLAAVLKSEIDPNEKVKKSITSSATSAHVKRKGDELSSQGEMKGQHPEKVSFFGLQCLASNGRVFNVTLPKLDMEKQVQLLRHLQEVPKRKKSLTGLYVTVKYSTLTEHGIPRFGTVKAIRGGKGWFL